MYFYLYDSQGNQIYDSHPSVSNSNTPLTWTLPNIPLQNNNYTLHVWDEDGGLFGADDDLGAVTFPGGVPVEQPQVHWLVFPVRWL